MAGRSGWKNLSAADSVKKYPWLQLYSLEPRRGEGDLQARRPHGFLGNLTPEERVQESQGQLTEADRSEPESAFLGVESNVPVGAGLGNTA